MRQIQGVYLHSNLITSLPPGLFNNAHATISMIALSGNRIASLPANTFQGLGVLTDLQFAGNVVQCDIFARFRANTHDSDAFVIREPCTCSTPGLVFSIVAGRRRERQTRTRRIRLQWAQCARGTTTTTAKAVTTQDTPVQSCSRITSCDDSSCICCDCSKCDCSTSCSQCDAFACYGHTDCKSGRCDSGGSSWGKCVAANSPAQEISVAGFAVVGAGFCRDRDSKRANVYASQIPSSSDEVVGMWCALHCRNNRGCAGFALLQQTAKTGTCFLYGETLREDNNDVVGFKVMVGNGGNNYIARGDGEKGWTCYRKTGWAKPECSDYPQGECYDSAPDKGGLTCTGTLKGTAFCVPATC